MTPGKNSDVFYYLHVDDDGTEHRYVRHPLTKPCLRVLVLDDWEETVTNSRLVWDGVALVYIPVTPRGKGWVKKRRAYLQPNGITVWRRARL
jgi:hypothetical protein